MHILKYFTEPAEVKPMKSDPSPSIKTMYSYMVLSFRY